jgi:hypothetical protein
MEQFRWQGQIYVRQPEIGFVLAPAALEGDLPELDDVQVLERYLNEEGRCFAGDDAFNHRVEQAAQQMLASMRLSTESSASSYGLPVLQWGNRTLGRGELSDNEQNLLARLAWRLPEAERERWLEWLE